MKTNTAKKEIRSAIDEFSDRTRSNKDELASIASDEYKSMKNIVEKIPPYVESHYNQVVSNVSEKANELTQRSTKMKNNLEDVVKKHPWKTLGGVSLASMAIGMLLRSRK